MGNSASNLPPATSRAAAMIGSAISAVSLPRSRLAIAAAALTKPRARIRSDGELGIEFTAGHLAGRGDDRLGDFGCELAEVAVGHCCRGFDQAKGTDQI